MVLEFKLWFGSIENFKFGFSTLFEHKKCLVLLFFRVYTDQPRLKTQKKTDIGFASPLTPRKIQSSFISDANAVQLAFTIRSKAFRSSKFRWLLFNFKSNKADIELERKHSTKTEASAIRYPDDSVHLYSFLKKVIFFDSRTFKRLFILIDFFKIINSKK